MIWGSISKTANIFWDILGSFYWIQFMRKNDTRNFYSFVYFETYNDKSKFSFLQKLQSRGNTFYLWTSHFYVKCWYHFSAIIFFYTLKKLPWENYTGFWKWNLKRTPQSARNSFSIKSNLKFCIRFNVILFANAYGSVKIKLACSNVFVIN